MKNLKFLRSVSLLTSTAIMLILLSCDGADSNLHNPPYDQNNIPVATLLEDFGATPDVSKTLQANGGFTNPSKTGEKVAGVMGDYEVQNLADGVNLADAAAVAKFKENILLQIYGSAHKMSVINITFHIHSFNKYKEDANSPVIKGALNTVKAPSDINPEKNVTTQGELSFTQLNPKTEKEQTLSIYFGNKHSGGNNGGIVFDKNNLAISGLLIIQSPIRIPGKDCRDPYEKKYKIEELTEIERTELEKLNLFKIAPAPTLKPI